MVMEVVHEDMAEGNMQCVSHPYKNSSPGGICAFCLQEKLGKLVSSSFPIAVFPPSSSSSPSFGSEVGAPISAHSNPPYDRELSNNRRRVARSKLPFRLMRKKKKQVEGVMETGRNCSNSATFVFMRSRSAVTPGKTLHFLDKNHKTGFWSFLHTPKDSGFKKSDKNLTDSGVSSSLKEYKGGEQVLVEENESPGEAAVERKVSRSRSIGCGSRRFSGDFFERISTGFSDCTLRRAESQREGKLKERTVRRNSSQGNGQDCMKERVKCGRIFSAFIITSSSSSSSSSNWISSTAAEDSNIATGPQSHWRNRGWGWSLPSPIRAFAKPRSEKTDTDSNDAQQNMAKIPSLLAKNSRHICSCEMNRMKGMGMKAKE